jgi:hypothetical protein
VTKCFQILLFYQGEHPGRVSLDVEWVISIDDVVREFLNNSLAAICGYLCRRIIGMGWGEKPAKKYVHI